MKFFITFCLFFFTHVNNVTNYSGFATPTLKSEENDHSSDWSTYAFVNNVTTYSGFATPTLKSEDNHQTFPYMQSGRVHIF